MRTFRIIICTVIYAVAKRIAVCLKNLRNKIANCTSPLPYLGEYLSVVRERALQWESLDVDLYDLRMDIMGLSTVLTEVPYYLEGDDIDSLDCLADDFKHEND